MVNNRINKLRVEMKKNNIDYYIISSADAHQSEYVADYYKGRAYISGFTGSAGILLIGMDNGILWTDGRYFIQAVEELNGSGIEMYKMRIPGWPTLSEWIKKNVKQGETIGFDGKTFSVNQYKEFLLVKDENKIEIKMEKDLLIDVWKERPTLPKENAFYHDIKYCGVSARDKINSVRKDMEKLGAENYIISSLDDIAWLYNIRGNDIKNNPVVISYAIITKDTASLYVDNSKVDESLKSILNNNGVSVKKYEDIESDVENIVDSILIDKDKTSAFIYSKIKNGVKIIEDLNITTRHKAIKNKVEIENLKNCQIRDGVAMVKFIKWLKENIKNTDITEISASQKLKELRKEGKLFKGTSFDTIAGYKEHAAMMHYSATEECTYTLKNEGLFLVDSGGQYLDGTTDITRTFALGEITEEEKRDFTLVLKGHIALNMAKFLKGTTGSKLDGFARKPLWDEGIDYKCGTGHGVGFFLNVHEGPQGFTMGSNNVALEPGMILTNEPGIYRKGKHGIRTENTLVVSEFSNDDEMGEFYCFEVISMCPIDLKAIDETILSNVEKKWLNEYHKDVFDKLSPFLSEGEVEFLRRETKEI